jgi:hypothetical protein
MGSSIQSPQTGNFNQKVWPQNILQIGSGPNIYEGNNSIQETSIPLENDTNSMEIQENEFII